MWKSRSTIGGVVINRRPGERVVINHGELVVEVVEIHGKQARLSFKAEKDIIIRRGETEPGFSDPEPPVDSGPK